MLAEYRKRRDFVMEKLCGIRGVTVAEPQGAFYAYPNMKDAMKTRGISTALEFAERLLKEAHVAVVPGEAFGTAHHVRISYATSLEELERGLNRIRDFVEPRS